MCNDCVAVVVEYTFCACADKVVLGSKVCDYRNELRTKRFIYNQWIYNPYTTVVITTVLH